MAINKKSTKALSAHANNSTESLISSMDYRLTPVT